MRVNLWLESLKLRARCNESFHTVLYFFDYGSTEVEVRSRQRVLSLILLDLKYKYPDEVLLLPIAANLDLDSVDVIRENYNISISPSIIIDESYVLSSIITLDELEKEIFNASETNRIIILNS